MTPVFYVCDAASGATEDRWNRIREESKTAILGNAMNLAFPDVDNNFGTPDLGDAFRAPLGSDVPTLFISGTLDSNTPPWQAEEVAKGLKDATLLVIENAGHEDTHINPKVQETLRRYLRGEDVQDVRISLPAPRFIPIKGNTAELGHPALR